MVIYIKIIKKYIYIYDTIRTHYVPSNPIRLYERTTSVDRAPPNTHTLSLCLYIYRNYLSFSVKFTHNNTHEITRVHMIPSSFSFRKNWMNMINF